ncbi:peptidylprolyl isomerase [Cesiribacter andamanensis]|uniref:Peptidyl-prolyl cis-trans isomerase n=1 Tax=Cesiribacter andamanensis AMV16 TaxID=1279009 RepID=M7NAH3_9BACT|nr:peptidylprolyl isomerase [Cesiribacter andamanensis]EMR04201.1 Putative peptidyl-prolyl cis-trans isomerase [Cesiribacter andamanensis AMV16]
MIRIVAFTFCVLLLASCKTEKDSLVIIQTRYGDMTAILFDATPRHKENFLSLARSGAFDSTTFHRVIQEFMIQGGDVNAKTPDADPIDYTLPAEFNDSLIHRKGALAAARQADQVNPKKESSGSQFYIVQGKIFQEEELRAMMFNRSQQAKQEGFKRLLGMPQYLRLRQEVMQLQQAGNYAAIQEKMEESLPLIEKEFGPQPRYALDEQQVQVYTTIGGAPHLDREYTVFGQIVEGLSVIDSIASVRTAAANRPVEDIHMRLRVEDVSLKELRKRYPAYYPKENKN